MKSETNEAASYNNKIENSDQFISQTYLSKKYFPHKTFITKPMHAYSPGKISKFILHSPILFLPYVSYNGIERWVKESTLNSVETIWDIE
jgi:hypothetical protein